MLGALKICTQVKAQGAGSRRAHCWYVCQASHALSTLLQSSPQSSTQLRILPVSAPAVQWARGQKCAYSHCGLRLLVEQDWCRSNQWECLAPQLPGRNERRQEPFLCSAREIAERLLPVLQGRIGRANYAVGALWFLKRAANLSPSGSGGAASL